MIVMEMRHPRRIRSPTGSVTMSANCPHKKKAHKGA